MQDEQGREWIKVPDDRVADLELPEEEGDDVKGYADDYNWWKKIGGSTYVLQGSPAASQLSLGGDLFWK